MAAVPTPAEIAKQRARLEAARRAADVEAERLKKMLEAAQVQIAEELSNLGKPSGQGGLHSVLSSPKIQLMELGPAAARALKIAKTRGGPNPPPEVKALYDANLTPNSAAALCGTTGDVLKKAWATGKQFREIRPEWKATLAQNGVPASVWRSHG